MSKVDEETLNGKEYFMNVRSSLIANPQPAELVQPGQRPLHHPSVDPQPSERS
jgi:hypothetical protein